MVSIHSFSNPITSRSQGHSPTHPALTSRSWQATIILPLQLLEDPSHPDLWRPELCVPVIHQWKGKLLIFFLPPPLSSVHKQTLYFILFPEEKMLHLCKCANMNATSYAYLSLCYSNKSKKNLVFYCGKSFCCLFWSFPSIVEHGTKGITSWNLLTFPLPSLDACVICLSLSWILS